MIQPAADIPLAVAVAVAFFLLFGASLALIGAIGFLRLGTFYERIHAPTLGTSWGIGGVMIASMLYFSFSLQKPVLHELLIGLFVTVTTPITFLLLARAALYRDRTEGKNGMPGGIGKASGERADEEPVDPS